MDTQKDIVLKKYDKAKLIIDKTKLFEQYEVLIAKIKNYPFEKIDKGTTVTILNSSYVDKLDPYNIECDTKHIRLITREIRINLKKLSKIIQEKSDYLLFNKEEKEVLNLLNNTMMYIAEILKQPIYNDNNTQNAKYLVNTTLIILEISRASVKRLGKTHDENRKLAEEINKDLDNYILESLMHKIRIIKKRYFKRK